VRLLSLTDKGSDGIFSLRKENSVMELALPLIDKKLCTLCGKCVEICPEGVYAFRDDELRIEIGQACTYCGLCEEACPEGAVRLEYIIRWV